MIVAELASQFQSMQDRLEAMEREAPRDAVPRDEVERLVRESKEAGRWPYCTRVHVDHSTTGT
eukprot:SAG11_NODE_91_length_17102_cov_37.671343_7_plen_63_part_00